MPLAGRPPIKKGKSLAERQAARRGLSLRAVGISVKTERRYSSAISSLLPALETADSMEELDPLCEEWIEAAWVSGTPLGLIGDALCGIHFFWPQVKGHLRGAWRLYKNWRKLKSPSAPRRCLGWYAVRLLAFSWSGRRQRWRSSWRWGFIHTSAPGKC